MEEKLRRIDQEGIAEAVERYCAAGHAEEDLNLIGAQMLGFAAPTRSRRRLTQDR
jgi:hypothetical protein